MTDDTLSALVRACVLAPADAAPRLVLADHLEETGALDADRAAFLRNGTGAWGVAGRRVLMWCGRWWLPVVVGDIPPEASPRCRDCATPSHIRFTGDWLCTVCRHRPATVVSLVADGGIALGDMVSLTHDGRVRRATSATGAAWGVAVATGLSGGRVTVRLT